MNFRDFITIKKANPYHDAKGRSTTRSGAASGTSAAATSSGGGGQKTTSSSAYSKNKNINRRMKKQVSNIEQNLKKINSFMEKTKNSDASWADLNFIADLGKWLDNAGEMISPTKED